MFCRCVKIYFPLLSVLPWQQILMPDRAIVNGKAVNFLVDKLTDPKPGSACSVQFGARPEVAHC
jgi:hypothetical protein